MKKRMRVSKLHIQQRKRRKARKKRLAAARPSA